MKVSEFKRKDTLDPDIMTVADLYEHCVKLLNEGKDDAIILIPNDDYNIGTDYRCLKNSIEVNDSSRVCICFDTLTSEEEDYITEELFPE